MRYKNLFGISGVKLMRIPGRFAIGVPAFQARLSRRYSAAGPSGMAHPTIFSAGFTPNLKSSDGRK